MINLEHMDLSHNLLAELPLSINELRKLETLDVRNCHLRYLPYTMNDLRNTLREVIRLYSTYPTFLGCLHCISLLRVGQTNPGPPVCFQATPSEVNVWPRSARETNMEFSPTPFTQIFVDFNYIVDIPRKMSNMQGLKTLSLTQNLLRELRPGNLEALTNLERLKINHNKMKSVDRNLNLLPLLPLFPLCPFFPPRPLSFLYLSPFPFILTRNLSPPLLFTSYRGIKPRSKQPLV